MHTKDFSIFARMVGIAEEMRIEYKILYSYHQKNAPNCFTENYVFVLITNLFLLTYEGNYVPNSTIGIKEFIKNNDCIRVDFSIKPNLNVIELS